jgi:hypothetical protein
MMVAAELKMPFLVWIHITAYKTQYVTFFGAALLFPRGLN